MELLNLNHLAEEVEKHLRHALEKLINNRIKDGAFVDTEDVKDKKYFSTLEGLDCLLIPFVNLKKNRFWLRIKESCPDLEAVIIEDINYVLNFNKHKTPPDEQGYPYFTQRKLSKHKPYWTTECASFTLSVLTNFLELKRKFGLSKTPDDNKIIEAIEKNIGWIKALKRGNQGWTWISSVQAKPHPWPTWSLLDTFDEMLDYIADDISEESFNEIERDCDDIAKYIAKSFKDKTPGSYYNIWNEEVINRQPYNIIAALDLSRLMLAANLHMKERAIFPIVLMLYKWASKTNFSNIDYQYNLEERSEYIPDSSLVPCIFRMLVIMAGKFNPQRVRKLDEKLGQDHKIVINRVYNILMESRINHGKYEGLWGVVNGGLNYELYFTERTIEALTEFIAHYGSKSDSSKMEKKDKENNKEKTNTRVTKKTVPPDDANFYTVWIPQLAERKLPEELYSNKDWPKENLLEYYFYRLFNNIFALDATQWGYKKTGEPKPDSRIILPDGKICLCDVKSSSGSYNISMDEYRKFVDYAREGKKTEQVMYKEILCLLIIANSFEGNIKERSEKFQADTNIKLVCTSAKHICKFAENIQKRQTDPTKKRLIDWSYLLSKGNPLVNTEDYEKIQEKWLKDLGDAIT